MAYEWNKLIERAIREDDSAHFYHAVYKIAQTIGGIDFDDRRDFAQSVCLAMLEKDYIRYLYIKLGEDVPVVVYVRKFIRWKRGDWYRKAEKIESQNIEDISEHEIPSTQEDDEDEAYSKEMLKRFIGNIVPRINNEKNLRVDAKENTIKVFLLSQIFLGELMKEYSSAKVLEILKVDLSKYGIQKEEIGHYTIEGIAGRLKISTTGVTNSLSRVKKISRSLAEESNLAIFNRIKTQRSRLDSITGERR